MEENKIEKTLNITKTGKHTVWTYTNRYTSLTGAKYGYSSALCNADGTLAKVSYCRSNYTKVKQSVRLHSDSIFIHAKEDINGTLVEIFKVTSVDTKEKKVIFTKVATYKDNAWDNKEFLQMCKRAITSVKSRAKKYYYLRDVK